jgi:uncharacterized protein YecT (DUF1311 family)
MKLMFKRVLCNCRGFSLAVPLLATFAYVYWQQPAMSGDPNVTNAILHTCVDAERTAGRSGRVCIGRVTGPCKAKPDNAHREDKIECDEREFVLWSQLVQKEFAALKKQLKPAQQEKLQNSQNLWIKYQSDNCRVPYALFTQEMAEFSGPACTIEVKASRALQLRGWRDAFKATQ